MAATNSFGWMLAFGIAASTACTGEIFGDSGGGTTPDGTVPPSTTPGQSQSALSCPDELKGKVPETPLRRLTDSQYDHTVRDLFGLDLRLAESFPPGDLAGPFPANGISPVSDAHVRKFESATEEIASAVSGDVDVLRRIVPCDPANGSAACAEEFITTFGKRAFRRPLDDAQRAGLLAVYQVGASSGFRHGIRLVLEAMLQSPYFLYHAELVLPGGEGPMVMLDRYELASRLSYFLWDTMPDESLVAAAESGELDSAAGLRAQAERLLADPKFSVAVQSFAINWLGIRGLRTISRDEAQFPIYSPAIGAALEHANFETVAKLQVDQLALALQCGLTKVATMQFSVTDCELRIARLNTTKTLHGAAHGGSAAERLEWSQFMIGQVAYVLQKLESVDMGNGQTLLDRTLIVIGTEMFFPTHGAAPMPFFIAGGQSGYFRRNTFLDFGARGDFFGTGQGPRHTKLLTNILQAMGQPHTRYGQFNDADSVGSLDEVRA